MELSFPIIVTALLLHGAVASGQEAASPVVTTKTGQVRGKLISLSPSLQVYQFTAIPFAEPPIGENRFRKPVPKTPWQGVLNATTITNACYQLSAASFDTENAETLGNNATSMDQFAIKGKMSEDCLYLNIWVPKTKLDCLVAGNRNGFQLLPVYIFIHGGAFLTGATSFDIYNGAVLAAHNNIVVSTIQYRLGSLGFAYLGDEQVPGNMGLWDQLEAMKWISENIAAFGGSNNEITLGGESAGAVSVTLHLLSSQSRPYFQRAIVESGSANAYWGAGTARDVKEGSERVLNNIATTAKCPQGQPLDMLPCLGSVDANSFPLADAMDHYLTDFSFGPVIDGDFVLREPAKMLEAGDFHHVPLLIGANKDEGSMFMALSPEASKILPRIPKANESAILEALTMKDYATLLKAGLKMVGLSSAIDTLLYSAIELQYWPQSTSLGFPKGRDVVDAAVAAVGDRLLLCPTYTWAQVSSTFDEMGSQIYSYYFSHRRSEHPTPAWMGVLHTDEMQFVFGQPFAPHARNYGYSSDDKAFSRIVMAYWANFIKYGNPNEVGNKSPVIATYGQVCLRHWPAYVGETCSSQTVELSALRQVYGCHPLSICGLKSRDCMFWETFFPKLAKSIMSQPKNVTN